MLLSSSLSSVGHQHQHRHRIVVLHYYPSWCIMIRRCLPYQQVIMMLIIILLSIPYYSVMSDNNVDKMFFFQTNRHCHDSCHDFDTTSKTSIILKMNDNNDETRNDNINDDACCFNNIKSLIATSSSIRWKFLPRTIIQSPSMINRRSTMTTVIHKIQRGGGDGRRLSNIFRTEYKDNHTGSNSSRTSRTKNKDNKNSTNNDFSSMISSTSSSANGCPHKKKNDTSVEDKILYFLKLSGKEQLLLIKINILRLLRCYVYGIMSAIGLCELMYFIFCSRGNGNSNSSCPNNRVQLHLRVLKNTLFDTRKKIFYFITILSISFTSLIVYLLVK